jgi:uncharacterized delta-60 repeat protein
MREYKVLFILTTILCSLLPAFLYSQVDTAWVRRYNGPGNYDDAANAIAVDGQGNVYVTGYSYGSGTSDDYATIKYNSAGQEQWVQRYNGPGNDADNVDAIAVDAQGNIYVTGYSCGSGTFEDYATIKYNSTGQEQWVARYNGPGNSMDMTHSLAVDGQGNVYVTGSSDGSGTISDYATIKYNSAGVEQWVQRYNGPGNNLDAASAIALDGQGNVYVTGWSGGSGTNYDYATIKYNSVGVQQWVQRYNGPGNDWDVASAIALDGQDNVYVTGRSDGSGTDEDYATIKYNSTGVEQWAQRYNGPGNNWDVACAIALDGQGNVYVTGYSDGSGTDADYATIKYNSAGVEQWVQRYNGPGNDHDMASAIAVDGLGNVYVTGRSASLGSYPFNYDYATIKYNSAGVEQWVQRYNGPGNYDDVASAIAVDGQDNVYVTGRSYGSGTDADYATIKYVQASGVEENHSPLPTDRLSYKIFPNPARNYFTICLPEMLNQVQHDKMSVKIFDVSGKAVKELESFGIGELRVSLDGIKNGVYFVKINNNPQVTKIIVTK